MGLIAGIYTTEKISILEKRLLSMLNCQAHRDRGAPATFVENNIAFGMVNRHDTLFCEKELHSNGISSSSYNESHVRAIVDGIVLDVPNHRQYFEDMGCSVCIPACSAIVAASYDKWELDFMDHLEGESHPLFPG